MRGDVHIVRKKGREKKIVFVKKINDAKKHIEFLKRKLCKKYIDQYWRWSSGLFVRDTFFDILELAGIKKIDKKARIIPRSWLFRTMKSVINYRVELKSIARKVPADYNNFKGSF